MGNNDLEINVRPKVGLNVESIFEDVGLSEPVYPSVGPSAEEMTETPILTI